MKAARLHERKTGIQCPVLPPVKQQSRTRDSMIDRLALKSLVSLSFIRRLSHASFPVSCFSVDCCTRHPTRLRYNESCFVHVNDSAGLDLKSLAINFASCVLFVLPLAMYLYPEYMKEEIGAVALSMCLSLLVPPMGWKRPHPYSDMPDNRPYPRKNQ